MKNVAKMNSLLFILSLFYIYPLLVFASPQPFTMSTPWGPIYLQMEFGNFPRYRELIGGRMKDMLSQFGDRSNLSKRDAKDQVQQVLQKYNELYLDAIETRRKQQQSMKEINDNLNLNRKRPKTFDYSLDDFRRAYNGSVHFVTKRVKQRSKTSYPYGQFIQKKWRDYNLIVKDYPSSSSFSVAKNNKVKVNKNKSFSQTMDELSRKLEKQLDQSTSDFIMEKRIKRVRNLAEEITRFQEELLISARQMSDTALNAIDLTLTTKDMRQEAINLQKQLDSLEMDRTTWVNARIKQLETGIKDLQNKIAAGNIIYEEFLMKRRNSMHYTAMNDATFAQVLNLIDPNDPGWEVMKGDENENDDKKENIFGTSTTAITKTTTENDTKLKKLNNKSKSGIKSNNKTIEEDIIVHRKLLDTGKGAQYACVRAQGIIRASPEDILTLFEDITRVSEYNQFFAEGKVLETVADDTQVLWASAPPIFPFKPRDFCTVVHFRRLKDGTIVVLNRATTHPDAPVTKQFVRGEVLIGANIIQPIPNDPHSSRFTMLTQVDPGGFSPPVVINQICSFGPPQFFRDLEKAANRKPSKKVLEAKQELQIK